MDITIPLLSQCLNNPGICNGLSWVQGLSRGPRPAHESVIACTGQACKARAAGPKRGSNSCHIGLCVNCCVLAHQATRPQILHCTEQSQIKAFEDAQQNDAPLAGIDGGVAPLAAPAAVPPLHPQAALTLAAPMPASMAPAASLPQSLSAEASVPPLPAVTPATPLVSYAQPLSLTYIHKLQQMQYDNDNENMERNKNASDLRTYSNQKKKTVTVFWWSSVR